MSILKRIEDIVLATEHKLRHPKSTDDAQASNPPQEPIEESPRKPELDNTFELVEV